MTTYFSPKEFRCKCGRTACDARTEIHPDLLARLTQLRTLLGRPVIVRSGLRCKFWNAEQGGVATSEHVTGEGVDIACRTSAERWRILETNWLLGDQLFSRVGIGANFVHLGISPRHPARVVWTYYPTPTARAASPVACPGDEGRRVRPRPQRSKRP